MIQSIRVFFTPGRPQPPERSKAYLRWLKGFPCVACSSCRWIDPAHFGPHGIATKASDYDALPLCRKCHDEQGKSALTFAEMKGLDVPALQEWFRGMWMKKQERKAA
jgi:hypothetical protein